METEKEKILNGELCYAADPQLVKERERARKLTRLYDMNFRPKDKTPFMFDTIFCNKFESVVCYVNKEHLLGLLAWSLTFYRKGALFSISHLDFIG